MTLIDSPPDNDTRFVGLATEIGEVAAKHAAEHDRDATFVGEAYAAMRERGYLALAVPEELGGLGASIKQVCHAQAELARHDGATALASAMHQYLTLMQVFRRRKGAPDAEGVLRRIADEGIVIATSGGSDWLWPTTTAVEVDGGYVVNGRKAFCSQSPGATVVATCAVVEGVGVIHFSVPFAADGVRIEETWDTLGMRGTASHDVVIEDFFVPAEKITGRRPYGEFGGPLAAAAMHFAPVVGSTYYGIGAGARDLAVATATAGTRGPTSLANLPRVQRAVGLMDTKLRVAWWSLMGAVGELGPDYEADAATLNTVMIAKREAVTAATAVVDLAMDVVGGRAYFRRFPLERAYRDVRAGAFHPFTPELTLTYAGKLALGDSGVTE
ncbi:acyl-CoA dehydrogenase family protein [Actinokineospora sp. HUAS TT18]|uniref:acyl-CoA dehydrogenase family protein n=1 Tax=Actinokineospora sp. HUAS TT18 TaxID=3447451 RepID=UPI003F51E278